MQYVVIACHFDTKGELCETTKERLRAIRELYKQGDSVLVTGDVPYKSGSSTLAELMKDWLWTQGISGDLVQVVSGGVGTFSEAQLTVEHCAENDQTSVTVISSSWYLFAGKPIWSEFADKNKVSVKFVAVKKTGGWLTLAFYTGAGIVVRASKLFGFFGWLERKVTNFQGSRRQGFTANGCV